MTERKSESDTYTHIHTHIEVERGRREEEEEIRAKDARLARHSVTKSAAERVFILTQADTICLHELKISATIFW